MNIRVVYLSDGEGHRAGEVANLNAFKARTLVDSGAASYYSNFSASMLKEKPKSEEAKDTDTSTDNSKKKANPARSQKG